MITAGLPRGQIVLLESDTKFHYIVATRLPYRGYRSGDTCNIGAPWRAADAHELLVEPELTEAVREVVGSSPNTRRASAAQVGDRRSSPRRRAHPRHARSRDPQ
jgi:hypothetical protein